MSISRLSSKCSLPGKILFSLVFVIYSQHLCLSQTGSKHHNVIKADSLLGAGLTTNAIELYNASIKKLKETGNTNQLAEGYLNTGQALLKYNQFEYAKGYLLKGIKLSKTDTAIPLKSDAYNNLGIVYEYTGKADSSFYYYAKALELRLTLNDTSRISESYRNMAQILRLLRRLDEARLYCRRAYEMIPGIKNYKTIANIYNETAYLFELDKQLDSAKFFYQKLIYISEKNNYKRGISVGMNNLASILETEKNYTEALNLKKESLNIDKTIHDIYGIMTSYVSIAETYQTMDQNDDALSYLDSATMICDTSWINNLHEIAMLKYRAYKNLGHFESALKYHEEALVLSDSIFNETKRKNIAEILTRFETKQKEQAITLLKQENQLRENHIRLQNFILAFILFSIVAGTIIFILILNAKNRKVKQMQLELQNFNLRQTDHFTKEGQNKPKQIYLDMGLTQRESEILYYLGRGCTNNAIAEKLFISKNTVKYHIKNIYIKLDVKNRVEALICCKSNKKASV